MFLYNIEKYKKELEDIVKDEEIYKNQCNDEEGRLERIKALKEELKSFLEAVDEGKDPVITGEDGLNALKMVIAASKSSRAHKPISFDELD